jgi:hypothetical protein
MAVYPEEIDYTRRFLIIHNSNNIPPIEIPLITYDQASASYMSIRSPSPFVCIFALWHLPALMFDIASISPSQPAQPKHTYHSDDRYENR